MNFTILDTKRPSNYRANEKPVEYDYGRLCLENVPKDTTKPQIKAQLLKDFENISERDIYMPKNTWNNKYDTKLCFVTFQRPWEAKVARELINFRKVCNIAANFARKNIDADIEEKLPTLVEPRTRFTEGEVPEKGTCAHCRGEASLICRTCYSKYSSTFYCSEDHQHRDWSIHKYDCKPLPKLIRPDEVAQAIANSEQPKPKVKYIVPHVECFKSGDTVEIMHVTSERVLYVRPLSENFDKLNDEIEDAAQKAGKMGDTPELDDTVFAFYGGIFRRAQVIDLFDKDDGGNDLLCLFIDYGFTAKASSMNLRKLNYKTRALPRQTFKVILETKKRVNFNSDIEKYLARLCESKEPLQIGSTETHGIDRYVTLQQRNGVSVNTKVYQLGSYNEKMLNRVLYDYAKIIKIPSGSNIKIRVVDACKLKDGIIACMLFDNFAVTWHRDAEINDYGNCKALCEPYLPVINELCLVKYETRWERAAAIDVDVKNEKIVVLLVDKLLMTTVSDHDVRRIPQKFTTSFFTQQCIVDGITEENFVIASENIKSRSTVTASQVSFDNDRKCLKMEFDFLQMTEDSPKLAEDSP